MTQSFLVPVGGTGFTTFTFDDTFRRLTSVRWRSGGFGPAPVGNVEQIAAVTVAPSTVPEPATAALVGAGLLAAAGLTRRRAPARR